MSRRRYPSPTFNRDSISLARIEERNIFKASAIAFDTRPLGDDPNGNVAAISDGATGRVGRGDRLMAYDALDRLLSAASPMFGNNTTGTVNFSHDALDNLTNLNMPATGPTHPMPARNQFYCYDMNWRLTSLRDADGCAGSALSTLTYDVQGNVASKDGLSYDFDYGNRLREVDAGATLAESYRYDAYGRRALSFAPSGNLLSFYDQAGQLMYQRDLRQGKLLNYIYLGGSLIAIADQGLWGGAVTAKRYQHTDALGTPVAVTDENRNVIERSEYEPYGLVLNRAQHDGPGFTGHVQDALTGLTYMQQRYYDPMIGRFLSVDPVTAYSNPVGAFNRYDYAGNNPYRFTDPDGRCPKDAKITQCVESNIPLNGVRSDAVLDSQGEKYSKSLSAKNAAFSDKEPTERGKAVVENDDGKLVAKEMGNVTTKESRKGYSFGGTLPPKTKFVIHGHVNKSMVDIGGGYGDSQPPLVTGKPNVTVTGDNRVGAREIEGSVLQHRMLRGQMTEYEAHEIQLNMNQAAELYNSKHD